MNHIHPGQIELLVLSLEQVEVLSSAQKSDVFWSFSEEEPRSINQVAEGLGKSASATTYHVHELVTAGLLIAVGERKKRSRVEKLYVQTGRRVFSAGPTASPVYREKAVEGFAAMARLMVRERQAVNETYDLDTSLSRFVRFGRFSQTVSPERAEEFATRVLTLIREFVAEPPDEEGVRIGIVFNMTPTQGESRKRLAELKEQSEKEGAAGPEG